jgi:hypothetical protein
MGQISPHCEARGHDRHQPPGLLRACDRRTCARIEIEALLSSTCFTVAAGVSNAALTVMAGLLALARR